MRILSVLAVLVAFALPAWAGNHALVIGNAGYRSLPPLATPHADAALIAQALQERGFAVTTLTDLDRDGFREALRAFRATADTADVVAIYFSGYGLSAAGRSYLVPVDASTGDARDADWELIGVDDLLRQVAGAKVLRALFLDASRPLGAALPPASGYAAGLAPVETAPPVTLVGHAAAPGAVLPDMPGRPNAAYATALSAALAQPIADPVALMQEARRGTATLVPGTDPYVFSNIGAPPAATQPPVAAAATPPRAPLPEAEAKRELQRRLKAQKCYYGAIDGIWGGGSVRGMTEFVRRAGITFPVDRNMDEARLNAAIAVIEAHPEVTCPPRQRRSTTRRTKKKSDKPRFCPQYGSHRGCPDNY